MNKIIPYNNELNKYPNSFIKPNGKIILSNEPHKTFAINYFNHQNINSNILTKEELILYKLWLEKYKFDYQSFLTDFMVYIIGFDKITKNVITTANPNPHIRFYNYYLMDWNIETYSQLKYNYEKNTFEPIIINTCSILSSKDREAEEEINEIKTKILKKDRPYFFK